MSTGPQTAAYDYDRGDTDVGYTKGKRGIEFDKMGLLSLMEKFTYGDQIGGKGTYDRQGEQNFSSYLDRVQSQDKQSFWKGGADIYRSDPKYYNESLTKMQGLKDKGYYRWMGMREDEYDELGEEFITQGNKEWQSYMTEFMGNVTSRDRIVDMDIRRPEQGDISNRIMQTLKSSDKPLY